MQDIATTDQEMRLRCFGMAMNIAQMHHQFELQQWMQGGKNGTPPGPPQLVDFFTTSDDIFSYISDETSEVEHVPYDATK
jgi:hypothetical protein